MTQKEIIDRAYGHIPKEISMNTDNFSWVPSYRGVKYYWYVLIRKLRTFK